MTDREAFEKWCAAKYLSVDRHSDGEYISHCTRIHWDTWQAACKYKDEQK